MNILLVSQCSKNALVETRRILDQFAERRGERTWQTPITQAGLDTLYRLLRKTARKNTAVACHWIRGKNHTELLWIVGDARQFNERGATPTNFTRRDVLRGRDENDWHAAEDIRLLAGLAALFHDFGKASQTFQRKLLSAALLADPIRHEWVSLRLFEAFVGSSCTSDREWLKRLASIGNAETARVLEALVQDVLDDRTVSPFRVFSDALPLARAVGWLIVSHHRLPTPGKDWPLKADALCRLPVPIGHAWCGSLVSPKGAENSKADYELHRKLLEGCWLFPLGLPFDSTHWREHVSRMACAILGRPSLVECSADRDRLASPYVLHLARLALMLADHQYSSQPSHSRYGDPAKRGRKALHANTRWSDDGSGKVLNQRLDEHLIGVKVSSSRLVRSLTRLDENLPRLARHKGFRERSRGDFAWQNGAFELAQSLRELSSRQGFFGVNLASTGRGKTLANARILYALADPKKGARFTVALGLRTLTLQTGDAYQERLRLGAEDLAVLVGGAATRALHAHYRLRERSIDQSGSESMQSLLPGHNYIRYEGSLEEGPLKQWLQSRQGRGAPSSALLDAPVLVCTIDHLMPAVEAMRGGHQILPMLRLMTSDLVLDEPDDFDVSDLPALTRLVHWAGLLGSRVMLSSATLPPSLVQGLFLAYRAGREEFQRHRGEQGARLAICCAWFDEFGKASAFHGAELTGSDFLASHNAFIDKRIEHLKSQQKKGVRRRGAILPVPVAPCPVSYRTGILAHACSELAGVLREAAISLHRNHHSIDPVTGKRVSFGLIRMANIDPLLEVASDFFRSGAPEGVHIHLCVYHARHLQLVRAGIERTLDSVLKRHNEEAVFNHPEIRHALASTPGQEQLFIVLATAVAEVGRDHDYDWAIVEPSSMRSIIQLAGRVKRHRIYDCPGDTPNVLILERNVKALAGSGPGETFQRPGFETTQFPLARQCLGELLASEQWQVIDACARIRPRLALDPRNNLADLEHARLADLMLGAQPGEHQNENPVHWWWTTNAHFSGVLQNRSRFRDAPQGSITCYFLPEEDGGELAFRRLTESGDEVAAGNLLVELDDDDLFVGRRITAWAIPDYVEALDELATAHTMDLPACARMFGTVDLPGWDGMQMWRYHPVLGFGRRR